MTLAGTITDYALPESRSELAGLAVAPDQAVWFVEQTANKIGRITAAGVITEYAVLSPTSDLLSIVVAPDGAVWFTELAANKIGELS